MMKALAAWAVLCFLGGRCAASGPLPEALRPNILLILADDLGYGDLGCHGGKFSTPHIDSIARNGMSFASGYVTAPQCAPSRAGLMTGRYQQRFGFEYNLDAPEPSVEHAGCLPLEERTMGDHLRAAGYHTGIIGKWHLGEEPEFHPLRRGFDEFFGFLGGSSHYLMPDGKRIPGILRNNDPVEVTSYLTDVLGAEAGAFIERNKDRPWFLYLAFNAPHGPWEASQKDLDRFPQVSDEPIPYDEAVGGYRCRSERTYAAMVSALDDAVGVALRTLQDLNLDHRTLVVFLSDNGAPLGVAKPASNAPLRGEKGSVLEGGIRVPFFVQWCGHVPAGVRIHAPVSALDLLPTFLDLAGEAVPAGLDGRSLLDTLTTGKEPPDDRALYWLLRLHHPDARHSWGIRQGDWKFWRGPDDLSMPLHAKTALFHVAEDIHEDRDLRGEEPGKRKELETKLNEWMKPLQPPRWGDSKGKKPPIIP